MLLFCLNGQVELGETNLGGDGQMCKMSHHRGGDGQMGKMSYHRGEEDPKWGSSPTCGSQQECLSSLQSLGASPETWCSAPFVGQRPLTFSKPRGHPQGEGGPSGKAQLGEAGKEEGNKAGGEAEDDAGHTPPYNTPIDQSSEDKTITANVYFICYYMLTNYDDEIVGEISHLCKIIIKYWYILHKNLVLMGYFVLLSELFYEGGDSFSARLELLLGSRRFADLLDGHRLSDRLLGGARQSAGESSDSGRAAGGDRGSVPGSLRGIPPGIPPGVNQYSVPPIPQRPSLQDDLHAIFTNLIKSLQPEEHPLIHLDPEANCTLEQLNENIGTYYFRHLYNVFMLRRQSDVYLLRFLRGYLYFRFFNNHTDGVPVVREHFSVNYLLCLYETSNVVYVNRGTYRPQRDSSTILSEDNSLYSLNMYEQLDHKGSHCSGDKSNWTKTRFSHFRNIKDGLKLQDVGLIGDVSILFFLLTNERQVENHLHEVMFTTWDNSRESTGRETKREELVLTNKWWKEIHHFANSIDWGKRSNSQEGISNTSEANSTGHLAPTGDAYREEEEPPLKRKCKCLHFINFYMDALIVMLCTHGTVHSEGENKTETTPVMSHRQITNATNKQPISEEALQNDLVKDILQEYAGLYNSYFYLALQMKWPQGIPNLRMTMEKVFLFLTSRRVKKAHHIDATDDEVDLRQYYLSLLLICMNKCFCVSSLCGYQDLMERYFSKNFIFCLLNVRNPCSYVRELAEYTIQNVHLCRHGGVRSEVGAPSDSCISTQTGGSGVLCVPAHDSSMVDRMEDILNQNSEAISAYVYKKIIDIDSVHSCRKISTLTQFLVMHHFCHVYIFKDICVHIIKYARRMHFLYLDRQRKDEMAVLILTVFNYVLYLFYEHISRNRVELCVRGNYVAQVRSRLLHGDTRVNFCHLRGGAVERSGERGEDSREESVEESVENSGDQGVDQSVDRSGRGRGDQDGHPTVPLGERIRAPTGKGTPRSILHRDHEQREKKKLFLHNSLFFKFHGDLFNVVHLNAVSSDEAKRDYFKNIEEDMRSIINKAGENIPCERLVNILVDDDFYDLYDEKEGRDTTARRNPGEGATKDLKDNNYFNRRKYHQEVHYHDIRHTADHIFHFAKKFLCHEDLYVRFSAHLCALRCLFIFSTRLYELYPKIYQLWGYVKINFRKDDYMNDTVLLKIINYVATIDDQFSPNFILSDIIPELFRKMEKLEMGREMPKQSFEHRFLVNAMLLLVNLSKEESCFENIHPFVIHFCLKCLREGVHEQIKRLTLNIICNFFLSDIPKISQAIQNVRIVKERIDQMYGNGGNSGKNGSNGNNDEKLRTQFLRSLVKDVSIEQPLLFLSCFLQVENMKDVLSLVFHVDLSIVNFLSIYFEFLQMKYRYKCRLHQHCLLVSSHFLGGEHPGRVATPGGGTRGVSQSLA
ncbi:hypothetical protein C922_04260 [Plasmodium inui San Antonio 1]|uniref:Uncharacterized protein n=1 Tax=Plasmodium inui San Antonio 1 TaxID=1237626 RepID=W6ZWZ2_9APIC|nr:hypothetical protein C922_04260 [Plasmodium inui San Antonio 1]EUD65317.1 hypothetical protein C922_04260 [Plasmodium inui San Antonio 1]